jgi:putative hydrolase of the HAD superfamily
LGFDLFNTLITAEPIALNEAVFRLINSLQQSGLALELESFESVYHDAALRFFAEARRNGKETHNRFWISAALQNQGYPVPPDDPRIDKAVEKYFSAFLDYCRLLPGTLDMLETIRHHFPLGLLSNFTHPPAVTEIIDHLGLTPFFNVILISGDLGYRKPHPLVFRQLVKDLGVEKGRIMYVGDDPEADVAGARQAGLQPIWSTCVWDQDMQSVLGPPPLKEDISDCKVPRISTWQDLLVLLEIE